MANFTPIITDWQSHNITRMLTGIKTFSLEFTTVNSCSTKPRYSTQNCNTHATATLVNNY